MATTIRTAILVAAGLHLGIAIGSCKSQETKNDTKGVATLKAASEDAAPAAPVDAAPITLPPAPPLAATPLGLPSPPSPAYNPTTTEKVALGAQLFADPAISSNGKIACASCHKPSHGFSSSELFNTTTTGSRNQRHTPTLVNIAYHQELYWDGRSQPLEAHILGHWQGQLGVPPQEAVAAIAELPTYRLHFQRAFDSAGNKDRSAEALAAYVRTLLSGNSPWDRYEAGDASAVSRDAIAGGVIFKKKAGCATCHAPPLYTDLKFHNLGLPAAEIPDPGREGHTGRTEDRGAFKTPSLRSVSQSAPYFHNGSASTLLQVLEHKESQGSPRLSAQERSQLLAFLEALTGEPTR